MDDAAPVLAQVGCYLVLGTTGDVSAYRTHADAAIVGTEARLGCGVIAWLTTMHRCMTMATWV